MLTPKPLFFFAGVSPFYRTQIFKYTTVTFWRDRIFICNSCNSFEKIKIVEIDMHYASLFWACLMKLIRSGFIFLKNLLIWFSVILCTVLRWMHSDIGVHNQTKKKKLFYYHLISPSFQVQFLWYVAIQFWWKQIIWQGHVVKYFYQYHKNRVKRVMNLRQ